MKKKVASSILIALLLYSCQSGIKERQANKLIITLFDLSESTATPDIRSAYIKWFGKIIDSLNEGDLLIGACITEKSIQELKLPVSFEYPVFKPTTDNILLRKIQQEEFQKKLSAMKEEQIRKVEELLLGSGEKPKILKTDILSSLVLASNILHRYPDRKQLLIIFSDMIEDSESYNFEKIKLQDQKIKEILENEKNLENIPDLGGVRIYAIGAQARTMEKYNSIKRFWIEYFKYSGAELVEYSSSFLGLKEDDK